MIIYEEKCLQRLNGIRVLIHDIPIDIEAELNKEQIQSDVEMKLNQAGIKVLTSKEFICSIKSGWPCLNITIECINEKNNICVLDVELCLNQYVYLQRDNNISVDATTWRNHIFGYTEKK